MLSSILSLTDSDNAIPGELSVTQHVQGPGPTRNQLWRSLV